MKPARTGRRMLVLRSRHVQHTPRRSPRFRGTKVLLATFGIPYVYFGIELDFYGPVKEVENVPAANEF